MKTMKNLLVAISLMAASSTAMAMSTFNPSGSETGSNGILNVVQGDAPLHFGDFFGALNDTTFVDTDPVVNGLVFQFYELNVTGPSTTSNIYSVSDATTLEQDSGLWFSIWTTNTGGLLGGRITDVVGGGITAMLDVGTTYYLKLSGDQFEAYSAEISAVPVPAAGILFASALFGAGALSRRKKKATKSNMIGAFARAA